MTSAPPAVTASASTAALHADSSPSRAVGRSGPNRPLPGGTSALPTSPYYLNLLRSYLTDDYYPARLAIDLRPSTIAEVLRVVPR